MRHRAEKGHVLRVRNRRYCVGFVSRGKAARQEFGGPMVPGPWAYVFEMCAVIDNYGGSAAESRRNVAAGSEHFAQFGDVVEVDGVSYTVEPNGYGGVKLVKA